MSRESILTASISVICMALGLVDLYLLIARIHMYGLRHGFTAWLVIQFKIVLATFALIIVAGIVKWLVAAARKPGV